MPLLSQPSSPALDQEWEKNKKMRRNATLLIIVDGVPRQHQRETLSFTRYSKTQTADRWAARQQVALLSLSIFEQSLRWAIRFSPSMRSGSWNARTHTNSYKLQTCVTRSGPITLYARIVFVHPHGAKYYIQTEASCGLMAIVSPPSFPSTFWMSLLLHRKTDRMCRPIADAIVCYT